MLRNVTPLEKDCGQLCEKRCCKGDSETGMILFPGEKTDFPVKEINGRKLIVCDGNCSRENRPVSCMIFPLFPVVVEGRIKIMPDYRGAGICPLIRHYDDIVFNSKFIKAVRKSGMKMLKNKEMTGFLKDISSDILYEKELTDKFLTEDSK